MRLLIDCCHEDFSKRLEKNAPEIEAIIADVRDHANHLDVANDRQVAQLDAIDPFNETSTAEVKSAVRLWVDNVNLPHHTNAQHQPVASDWRLRGLG